MKCSIKSILTILVFLALTLQAKANTPPPLPVSDSWAFRQRIVYTALSYRGTKYRWGGTSRRGIDCSGLTSTVYSKQGLRLPRKANQQFKQGIPVSKANLLPGDLVFFGRYKRVSHVGIYIGKGKIVHASSTARRVRKDNLSSAYFRKRFVGARRPYGAYAPSVQDGCP